MTCNVNHYMDCRVLSGSTGGYPANILLLKQRVLSARYAIEDADIAHFLQKPRQSLLLRHMLMLCMLWSRSMHRQTVDK